MSTWHGQAPLVGSTAVHTLDDVQCLARTPLDVVLASRSTYGLIRNACETFGSNFALTFLRDGDPGTEPIRWRYKELLERLHQMANGFHSLGIGATDVIAVLLPACLEYNLAHWAGQAAGIVLPLNPLLGEERIANLIHAAGVKVLLAYGDDLDTGYWRKALTLLAQCEEPLTLVRVAPYDEPANRAPELPPGAVHLHEIVASQPSDRLVSGRDITSSDIAAYFNTGGTTGAPKLAMLTHANEIYAAWATVQMQGITSDDVLLSSSPLFHVAAALVGTLPCLSAGAETIIPTTGLMRNQQVVRNFWRLVETLQPTILTMVPTVLTALCDVPRDDANLSSIRYCRTGAAALRSELANRFEQLFKLQVHETFGMTEMGGVACISPPGLGAPAGCVGFPLPHVELRIVAVDEDSNSMVDVASGEAGLLLFRGPNVFPGYLNPDASAEVLTPDGWFISGDIGWRDPQGRVHLRGRAKDLIIRSGHNIDPRVIEEALAMHPAVLQCAAVGAPDAYAGEVPVAFVSLRPGLNVSAAELREFAAGRIDEAPARPKFVLIVDAIPLTDVGKVFKPKLKQAAAVAVVRNLVHMHHAAQDSPNQIPVPQVRAHGAEEVEVLLDKRVPVVLVSALEHEISRVPVVVHLILSSTDDIPLQR